MKRTLLVFLIGVLAAFTVLAQKPKKTEQKLSDEERSMLNAIKELSEKEKSLKFQTGIVTVGSNLAVLNLPEAYKYLNADDCERVLTEFWGNPPAKNKSLGMIVPADRSLLDENSWGVVITYLEDGHVNDDDAASINYDDLLKQLKDGTVADNEERKKNGYPALDLVGWAAPPHYDAANHKLYWAQNLHLNDENATNSLNYEVRALGRVGVLSLNAIAPIDQLEDIKTKMEGLLPAISFTQGNRYEDFNASTDKIAEYGIGALILGGVAAKSGILKVIGVALLKFIKPIGIGVVALLGFLGKKFFGGSSE